MVIDCVIVKREISNAQLLFCRFEENDVEVKEGKEGNKREEKESIFEQQVGGKLGAIRFLGNG
jgi:hypothetical protein